MPGTACVNAAKGFTLIELLLAMAISAFVAFVGYQGLRVAIDAAHGVEDEATRLADVQLALGILEADISQIVARPVRSEVGALEPVMAGGLSNDRLLTFTRDGWANPRLLPRSELARINYAWDGRRLTRQRWRSLDRVSREAGMDSAVLLDGVEDIRVEFFSPLTGSGNETPGPENASGWSQWWTSERQGLEVTQPLPMAVRITMTLEGLGRISRVIAIASV